MIALALAWIKTRVAGSALLSTLLSPPVLICAALAVAYVVGWTAGRDGAQAKADIAAERSRADALATDLQAANSARARERADMEALDAERRTLEEKVARHADEIRKLSVSPGGRLPEGESPGPEMACPPGLLGDDGRRRLLDIAR